MNDVKNDVLSFLNQIFEGNRKHTEKFSEELENHQHGQDPRLTTVVCSDSRVMQHEMWQNHELGREFTESVIGNHVTTYSSTGKIEVAGSIDYIPEHSDTETVVAVIGHTGCGAVTATYQTLQKIHEKDLDTGNIAEEDLEEVNKETEGINTDIKLIMDAGLGKDFKEIEAETEKEMIAKLVERNVDNQVKFLIENTSYTETVIVGLVYDMDGSYGKEKGRLYMVNFEGAKSPELLDKEVENYEEIRPKRIS